mmetsp:Transcript_70730/g.212727  ORF Transcript_70730/g.212727 Transcript_70730/m.212727 type:complete len:109 (+) Transcript_70730:4487-4813(+)
MTAATPGTHAKVALAALRSILASACAIETGTTTRAVGTTSLSITAGAGPTRIADAFTFMTETRNARSGESTDIHVVLTCLSSYCESVMAEAEGDSSFQHNFFKLGAHV